MKLAKWHELSAHTRQRLDERLKRIPKGELQKFAFWVAQKPGRPEWSPVKDFGTFKACGVGPTTTTFLDAGMDAFGEKVE